MNRDFYLLPTRNELFLGHIKPLIKLSLENELLKWENLGTLSTIRSLNYSISHP